MLAVAMLGSGVAFLDGTVVNVALREIGRDLNASTSSLQWMRNGLEVLVVRLVDVGLPPCAAYASAAWLRRTRTPPISPPATEPDAGPRAAPGSCASGLVASVAWRLHPPAGR